MTGNTRSPLIRCRWPKSESALSFLTGRIFFGQGKKEGKWNQTLTFYFDIEKCKTCALRDGCYKAGAKTKSYSISIKTNTQAEQVAFQETEEFKELHRRERYKIEAKNAELKNVLGYARAESYGMDAMHMQGAITMFAANVKRIIKLIEESR